tara:strand:- start:413 stop:1168 length:756 start_codon:yes stop_codon:yes gene_type:complete
MSESFITEAPAEESVSTEDSVNTESTGDPIFKSDEEIQSEELLLGKYKTSDDLAKAYKELESKLGTKEEDLRKSIMGEIETEAFKDRPESVNDYVLPDTVDSSEENELLSWWSAHAFENGFGQEEFEKGIEMYAQSVGNDSGPNLEAEAAKLGENSSTRIESANLFATKFFPAEAIPAIERMCESHEGIIALEHIMREMKEPSFSEATSQTSGLNSQALTEMMQDERYHNPAKRDRHFIAQVDAGFKSLYG